jgi:hypothetical protein
MLIGLSTSHDSRNALIVIQPADFVDGQSVARLLRFVRHAGYWNPGDADAAAAEHTERNKESSTVNFVAGCYMNRNVECSGSVALGRLDEGRKGLRWYRELQDMKITGSRAAPSGPLNRVQCNGTGQWQRSPLRAPERQPMALARELLLRARNGGPPSCAG